MRRSVWAALVWFVLAGCNGNGPPPPPPPPPTTTTTTSIQPRVDRRVDLRKVRGVTAFGATLLSEDELVAFAEHIQARGYNTMRVGAQTDGWCDNGVSYLPCGPKFGSEEWEQNLRRLLDVTSRREGIWIQLIPTFTHKEDGYEACARITERVIEIVQTGTRDDPTPFRHIVWEAVNEYVHPISQLEHRHVKRLLRRLRETGLPVGTDRSGGREQPWEGYYPEDLIPLVDYIAFHPPRYDWAGGECVSKLPGPNRLRRVISRYDKPVWMDETVKYVSDEMMDHYGIERGGGYVKCALPTEGDRRHIIRQFRADVEAAGGVWFTHAAWLFECKTLGWLP